MAEALRRAPLLELRSLTKEFPGVRALDGVTLSLERGEIHALCGENGAGKSTLVKILCGYYPAGTYGGEIHLDGKTVRFASLRAAEDAGIALIAQELALVPKLSVSENLLLGREPVRLGLVDWKRLGDEAKSALARVGLEVDPERPVQELGVGQQQMIEIAKALSKNATILVLDEPTAALPDADALRLLALLKELRGRGVTCLYISHRLEEVFDIADRITVLRDGVSVATLRKDETSLDGVISLMVGRKVEDLYPRVDRSPGATVFSVRGFRVEDPSNPGRFVLKDVDFDVRSGEILGIGGLMGAGRTALLASLFGASRGATSGRISILGSPERAPFRNPEEAIRAGVALVSEDRKRYGLILEEGVGENLTLVTLKRFVRAGLIDHARQEQEASLLVDSLRIKTRSLFSVVKDLSGGNQQKVVLGKWLITEPKVLFLDEPTRGVDIGAKFEIHNLMNTLASKGVGLVLVSSDLPELLGMSHRVLVLSQGRKAALLDPPKITPENVMAAATVKVRGDSTGAAP